MKANLILSVVKVLYREGLRDVIAAAVKDTANPIDDQIVRILDMLLAE